MPKQNGNIILVKKRKLSLPSFKKNEAMWYLYGISEALCLLLWCTSTAHPRTAWWDIFDSAQYSRICFFGKMSLCLDQKQKFFSIFCQMEPASLQRLGFFFFSKTLDFSIWLLHWLSNFSTLCGLQLGTTQNFLCLKKMAKFLTFLKLLISR